MKKYRILDVIKKYWYICMIYILFTYCLTQIVVVGSQRIAEVTDDLFAGKSIVLEELLLPFFVLMLLGALAAFGKSLSQSTFSLNVQTDIRNMVSEKLLCLPYQYLEKCGTGALMNKVISDVYQIEALFSEILPGLIVNVVTIITVCVYMGTTSIRLLLVTLICYPFLLWLANRLTAKLGRLTGKRRNLYDDLENVMYDAYQGITVGRSFQLYELQKKRVEKVFEGILENEHIRTIIGGLTFIVGHIIRWIPKIVCYLFALYETVQHNISLGEFMAYIMLLDKLVSPLGEMPYYLVGFRENRISLERIQDILRQPNEKSGSGVYEWKEGNVALELQKVRFAYTEGQDILKDISLKVKIGENIAIVGSSGSGKTTVMKMLCGFYEPQDGVRKMYGHNYEEWSLKALRRQIALVSQNVFLFPGTIAENVAHGKRGATREEVIKACKNANIHEFIDSLPNGYDTLVGERGAKLSGGQRQRISIARAFLKDAPILLLDEPTSAVDVETEQLIKDAIKKVSNNRTVITIAHRLSTIKEADTIYVLEAGQIVESGTHEQLLDRNGAYYALYMRETTETEGDAAYEL